MKKYVLTLLALSISTLMFSQKFAFVDTEYILNNIPSYKAAQEKLDQLSKEWQKEIEDKRVEVEKLYKDFQAEKILLSEDMKKRKEEDIVAKENEVRELQKKYFGKEGKLYEKRKELVKPIQDEVYNAIKQIAEKSGFATIFDSASNTSMLYTDPKFDKSDEVLEILGYKN